VTVAPAAGLFPYGLFSPRHKGQFSPVPVLTGIFLRLNRKNT
jgi:hypothetical protein